MPVLHNADASFSSKQELLDLQDRSLSRGPSLHSFSPLDSQTGSPASSGPASPGVAGAAGPAQPHIFTEASARPGHQCNTETSPNAGPPTGPTPMHSDSDQLCGWGPVTPSALQVFNTPRWVLFFLCVASFLQGIVINGFTSTVVTSIERRFDLQSYQTGLIISSFDIAACICLAFVSYFGGTGHKPRWLGLGLLIMALASLVFALPHFTTPSYQVSVPETGICSANRTGVCQGEEGGGLSSYRFVFMLGQFLNGMGSTPLYTLGVTYLDENVRPDYAPVYIGIFHTASIVGPAVGYLLGGYFLTIFTEIHLTTDLTPQDPLWVGAWWIGFLAGAPAFLLVALLILGYPRQLRGSQEFADMRVSEAHQLKDGSHTTASDPQFGKSAKDMPRSVLLLLKNPTFIFLCLAGATEATLVSSMTTFGPKFLESQFSLSASQAATIFGFMVVPAGGGGTFLGGYIVKRLSLRCQGIIRFCMTCATVSLLAIFIFLIQCPNVPMAGVTVPYQSGPTEGHKLDRYEHLIDSRSSLRLTNSSSVEGNLTAGCNAGCHCVRELYNPVCGADGIMYYSPCHAGCTVVNHTEGKGVYSGCGCVGGNVSSGEEGVVLAGKCSNSCQHMPLILSFFFITISFTFLCSIPALTATLRCVPHSQRSFALGIQWILVRALGTVPGPIAFGALIDNSCLLWQDKCGDQGSCYLYQNSTMSLYIMAAGIIYKVLGLAFFSLASISYRPPPKSPQSSCESTDHGGDLPDKDPAEDGVIVNRHARL